MIALITVPYDSGQRARRMGAGPLRILEAGAIDRLERAGHATRHVPIELPDQFWTEVGAARRLQQLVAEAAHEATARGERSIILSGNCNSSIGTVSGIGASDVGVVWLDAHPDLEMPDTTASGFFDGQALSTITGRCWRQIAATVPGYSPIPNERVVSVGGRDASDGERKQLQSIAWIREDQLEDPTLLDQLSERVRRVYLHVDLDIHGAESLRANGYASPGGPSPDEVLSFVRRVGERFDVAAAAITAFDPAEDADGRALRAALDLLETLATI